MDNRPEFVTRMDRIADLPTTGLAERAVLLAAVRWANPNGELWPALNRWARLTGMTVRSLQRVLRRLTDRGIVEVLSVSPGGTGKTTHYRIPGLLRNPDGRSGFQPRPARTETPTGRPSNPDAQAFEPRPSVTQSTKETQMEQPPTADGEVVARLSAELRDHPNLTPQRRAWIEREAPSKCNPAGWAAECIRKCWDVPTTTPKQLAADRREERATRLAAFDSMSGPERTAILAKVREAHRNLRDPQSHPDDSPAVRGAVADLLKNRGASSSAKRILELERASQ